MKRTQSTSKRREAIVAAALLLCIGIVGFWEIMSNRSKRGWSAFQFTARDMVSFRPRSDRWKIREIPIDPTPTEPNIAAYEFKQSGARMAVRLVHGYNMPDCMRLKHYTVELVADSTVGQRTVDSRQKREGEGGNKGASDPSLKRLQLWRLTSAEGDKTLWMTSMLHGGTFEGTDIDVREMAFPRIGIPEDPNWVPRGVTWDSLRDPIDGMRRFLNRKWNNSRADLAVFLKLKQPPWASDEVLTLVTAWRGRAVKPEQEETVAQQVLSAHTLMFQQLYAWRQKQLGEEE
jgi:hypothetical protein